MSYKTITFEIVNSLAVLTLNRPGKMNSFNIQMHEEIRGAVQTVSSDTNIHCLVITGAGRGFCAGQDLGDRAVSGNQETPDLGDSLEKNYNPLIRSIMNLEKPVICAVNGVAAGAGANLVLACDIVFAAESASFIEPFCKLGVVPDSGGTWNLPRTVGLARAKGLTLLGDKLSAKKAEEWGLIWRCLPDDRLMEEAMKLARYLTTRPTKGLAAIKKLLNQSFTNFLEYQLELEKKAMRELGRSHDYREGIAAFLENRKPDFRGE